MVSSSGLARAPLSTGRETQCRGQTTTDKLRAGSPALRLTELLSIASKEDTAQSDLCIALVILPCSFLGIERKKLVKSQLQFEEQSPCQWLTRSISPLPIHGLGYLQTPKRTQVQFQDAAIVGSVQVDSSLADSIAECKRDTNPVLSDLASGTGRSLPCLLLGHHVF